MAKMPCTNKGDKGQKSFNKNFLLICDQMTQVLKTCLFAMFSPETQLSSFSSTSSFSLLRSEGLLSGDRYNSLHLPC